MGYFTIWRFFDKNFSLSSKYNDVLNKCSILTLIGNVLLGEEWAWSTTEIENVLNEHINNRFKKNNIQTNILFDIALFVALANKYIAMGDEENAKEWFRTAYLDCSTNSKIQKELNEHIVSVKEFDIRIIFNSKISEGNIEKENYDHSQEAPNEIIESANNLDEEQET